MSTTAITSGTSDTQQTSTAASTNKKKTGELGKDAFLNLLVTQLKNQNPLEPVKDADFIAQMAQFSSLEQMQNLNKEIMIGRAVTMMGKNITFKHPETEQVTMGQVSGVKVVDGSPKVMVGDLEVPLSSVQEVR